MKNSVLLMIMVALFHNAVAQSHLGLEQYYYFGKGQDISLVSIGYYQNSHNWYGEVRYNYEEKKTMSIYAGKTFYGEGKLSYTATPMLGILMGQFNGGSLGINMDITYKNIDLLSQIQYVFSNKDRNNNFFLSWSELGYQVLPFMKSGIALQQSTVYKTSLQLEGGVFIGLSYKNWEVPIYVFSPVSKGRNFVIGINWVWQHDTRTNNNHGPVPSLKGRRKLPRE